MITYIYTISQPVTKNVIYVGKAINVEARVKQHMNLGLYSCVTNWMKALIESELKPVFTIVDKTDSNWRELEKEWILKFIADGHDLLNVKHNFKSLKRLEGRDFIINDLTVQS